MTKKEYQDYLQTPHWKAVSSTFRNLRRWTCERCGNRGWQVHHKNYKHLWHECASDLELLCDDCHAKHHGKIKEPSMREMEKKLDEWLRE